MSPWRCKEENPGCLPNRGFSIGGPDQRTSKFVSESHPAMIVAGCPVVPLETQGHVKVRKVPRREQDH